MSIQRLFTLVCSMIMIWSVPAFASSVNTESPKYTEKQIDVRNAQITFTSRTEKHEIDCRCYPAFDISIKENRAGVLQDDDIIYFETSKFDNKYIKNFTLDIKTKGVTAQEITNETENHFAIRISRTNKKEVAQIDIRFEAEFEGIRYDDKEMPPAFSLYINADNTKQNNLFAGEQNILLNDEFLIITNYALEREKYEQEEQKKFEQAFPKMVFMPNSNTMMWNDQQKQLKYAIYINQNGTAMISLHDFIDNIIAVLNKMEDIPKMIIKYPENEEEGYIIARGHYVCNINEPFVNTNGIIRKDMIVEKQNGMYYINLRGAAEILGVGNDIVWDNDTKTIIIGKEK